jgi:hypothetical protein
MGDESWYFMHDPETKCQSAKIAGDNNIDGTFLY